MDDLNHHRPIMSKQEPTFSASEPLMNSLVKQGDTNYLQVPKIGVKVSVFHSLPFKCHVVEKTWTIFSNRRSKTFSTHPIDQIVNTGSFTVPFIPSLNLRMMYCLYL